MCKRHICVKCVITKVELNENKDNESNQPMASKNEHNNQIQRPNVNPSKAQTEESKNVNHS